MKKFKISITETLQRVVEVYADNLSDAFEKVDESYRLEEIVLTADDYVGYTLDEETEGVVVPQKNKIALTEEQRKVAQQISGLFDKAQELGMILTFDEKTKKIYATEVNKCCKN